MLLRIRLAAGLLAGGLLGCSALAQAQLVNRAAMIALTPSIGRVEARLDNGRVGVGSAITVARDILVTNCHVTNQATSIKVIGAGAAWPATQEAADVTHDVCFLHVPQWPNQPVVLRGATPLRIGDAVVALGYTAATMTMRGGAITALHAHEKAQIIETDAVFNSGASGGGLFDGEGALVGMLTFRMRGASGHYFALPMQWIRDRLPRESQWRQIAPLGNERPFWAGDIDRLPLFMRAASFQDQGRWNDLKDVAEFWSAQDSENPEAHLALGIALSHLGAHEAAVESLTRSVALAPKNALAWFNLGEAYRANGNWGALRRVLDTLGDLDENLAERLRNETDKTTTGELTP